MDDMWLLGQVVMSALDATVCNMMPFVKRRGKGKYLDEPIRVMPKSEEEKRLEEEKALEQFIGFAGAFEKSVKSKNMKGE